MHTAERRSGSSYDETLSGNNTNRFHTGEVRFQERVERSMQRPNALPNRRYSAGANTVLPSLICRGSQLRFSQYTIFSNVYPQQGDPLGLLPFCLPATATYTARSFIIHSTWISGQPVPRRMTVIVPKDVRRTEHEGSLLDLHINHKKCEIMAPTKEQMPYRSSSSYPLAGRPTVHCGG